MPGCGLIATGAVGAILAAIYCATPLLAVVLGAMGLSAWLAGADYIVLAVLLAGIALIGLGLYRLATGLLAAIPGHRGRPTGSFARSKNVTHARIHNHLPGLRYYQIRNNADRRLPVLL